MWTDILITFLFLALELTLLFVGISFLLSLFQGYIPYDKIEKKLSESNFLVGAFFALILAFITPFCSCSTIPLIVNMLNRKIRFGTVMVFLFASPTLDPTILGIMTVMLGQKVAIIYIAIVSVLSVIIGFTLEKAGFISAVKNVVISGGQEYDPSGNKLNFKQAIRETFDLIKQVGVFILLGAGIGAIIKGAVPADFIANTFGGNQWWLIPIAAIVGIPLYIRLASMIPISQMLVAKGIALGPVMAMLISSAGASLPEITLLNSIFKKRLVVAFIISVISMSTISGFIFLFI